MAERSSKRGTDDAIEQIFIGMTRWPFQFILGVLLLIFVSEDLITVGVAEILMASLAGAMFAPMFNGLADLMYVQIDKKIERIIETIPSRAWKAITFGGTLTWIVPIIMSWRILGLKEPLTILFIFSQIFLIIQSIVYVVDWSR